MEVVIYEHVFNQHVDTGTITIKPVKVVVKKDEYRRLDSILSTPIRKCDLEMLTGVWCNVMFSTEPNSEMMKALLVERFRRTIERRECELMQAKHSLSSVIDATSSLVIHEDI